MKKFKVLMNVTTCDCRFILPQFEDKYGIQFEVELFSTDEYAPTIIAEKENKILGVLHLHGRVDEKSIDDFLKVFA